MDDGTVIHEFDSELGHYQVVDLEYNGRASRILFSGNQEAAQSGIANDGQSDLLFDYNQRFIEITHALLPKRILLIGGGVFTLPKAVLEDLEDCHIDAVELDVALLPIATEYFGLVPSSRLQVFHDHGRRYVSATSQRYDLVIIDAFIHTDIPPELASVEAFQAIKKIMNRNGVIAINVISSYYGRGNTTIRNIWAATAASFKHISIAPASNDQSLWLPLNLVLQASDSAEALADTRYENLPAITDITVQDEIHD